MSTLTNQQINATYHGLIKTTDNAAIDATPKALEDGVGNALPIEVGTSQINFTEGVDFSGATVTGLAAGGLVAGTQPDSMVSAAFLTPNPANVTGGQSIALGNGAQAASSSVSIGNLVSATGEGTIAIGPNTSATALASLAIGRNAFTNGTASVVIGNGAQVNASNSIGISGENITMGTGSTRSVGIGRNVTVTSNNAIAIGNYAKVSGSQSMSFTSCGINVNEQKASTALMMVPGLFGCTTNTNAYGSIVLGGSSSQLERATTNGNQGVAIGFNTVTNAANSVALGANVVANKANTTSVTNLEVQAVGGAITMYSPDGTEYTLTVANGGTLTITAV